MRSRHIALPAIAASLIAGCDGAATSGGNVPTPSCTALEDACGGSCPATWGDVPAYAASFCKENTPPGLESALVSQVACGGYLRLVTSYFDSGPRYYLFDPATGRLAGFRLVDGKAERELTSCGIGPSVFDASECVSALTNVCESIDAGAATGDAGIADSATD